MSPSAGTRPEAAQLVDLEELLAAYRRPPAGPVSFGTSGHRGTSLKGTFTEAHVLAISEAICRHRAGQGIDGPLFVARDTHALSEPAFHTAISVFSAHGLDVRVDAEEGYTPTPALSHAILTHPGSDGIVLTPSHNPPEDGGYKYNPPSGGPAGTEITKAIEGIANEILDGEIGTAEARVSAHDYVSAYVGDLPNVIDLEAIRRANVRIGADPLGGASVRYFQAIAETHGLNLEVVNDQVDPTFRFVPLDHDGKIRMDCSSPYVMAGLLELRDRFDVAVGCDPDADRHGIVTPSAGLLNPNHYLSVAIHYLFSHREWGDAGIGKTLVSSSMIDFVAAGLGRRVVEVPVGFKWFVDGLLDGSLGFGGEESAGASFLRFDGSPWSTDKDGILLALLAAEITAKTGRDPGAHYQELTSSYGAPVYKRVDSPVDPAQKEKLLALSPEDITATELVGEPIETVMTTAPGNGAAIGGVKVVAEHGWFAARPSGTEDIYKLYAESFRGEEHLEQIIDDARRILGMSKVLTMVLAGGEGKRLAPLTADRAKPAVPFGGNYRLIDFALSNLVNANYHQIVVLTQYKSHSLDKHVTTTWRLSPLLGNYVTPVPAQMRLGPRWFVGSADAIFQNYNLIADDRPEHIIVFGADHIYRMDPRQMVEQHIASGKGVTVAALRTPIDQADQFGVIETAANGRDITRFREKPKDAIGLPDAPDQVYASMGNYVFSTEALITTVSADAADETSKHDLGGNIIPALVAQNDAQVYDFASNEVPGATPRDRGYWRDVGTLDAYYDAHMDLISVHPIFNMYNHDWPIHTWPGITQPAKFIFDEDGRRGQALDSLVCAGVVVSGATVRRSILSPLAHLHSHAEVEDSILMHGVEVARNAVVRRAIVDKNVYIGEGVEIGVDPVKDAARFDISEGGIVVIPKGMRVTE